MSVYEVVEKLSKVTKIYKRKKYNDNYLVSVFYTNNKQIKYYYKDYSSDKLRSYMRSKLYDRKKVDIDFWDFKYCSDENLMEKDIKKIKKRMKFEDDTQSSVVAGYLVTLIGVYNIIYNSFIVDNFDSIITEINFDKNIVKKIFTDIDIVIDFNNTLLTLINNIYSHDEILGFLTTPSNFFRLTLRDMKYILSNTPNVHQISQIIYNTVDRREIIHYYYELLDICGNIYSPRKITSYNTEDILLNLLSLDIDINVKEKYLKQCINLYLEKGGKLDIDIDISEEYNEILIPLLDTIKEYRLS